MPRNLTSGPTIWFTTSPSEWSKAPEWMNIHFLLEAEKCPRRAALRSSRYEELGTFHGYPENPSQSILVGRITHASVARLVSLLALRGCNSVRDPGSVAVLKQFGGYSRVIAEITDKALTNLSRNPRIDRVRESLAVAIRSKIPVIREQVQVLLSRMKWTTRSEAPVTQNGKVSKNRSPLVAGTHFEVELKSQSLKWKGIADLIQLNEDGCVITDFKTGEKQEQHRLQLLVYGLLWRGDAELNPGEELPNRLVISYPNGDEVIAPVVSKEIDELSDLLKSRTSIVRNALQIVPPKAILSPDNCPSCDVRILCQDYWTSERTVKCGAASRNDSFDDLEIVLIRRLGQLSWEAAVKRSDILRIQTKLVLRLSEADALLQEQFSPNRTLRLTNALHSTCDEGDIPVVRITSYTEPLFDTN